MDIEYSAYKTSRYTTMFWFWKVFTGLSIVFTSLDKNLHLYVITLVIKKTEMKPALNIKYIHILANC